MKVYHERVTREIAEVLISGGIMVIDGQSSTF